MPHNNPYKLLHLKPAIHVRRRPNSCRAISVSPRAHTLSDADLTKKQQMETIARSSPESDHSLVRFLVVHPFCAQPVLKGSYVCYSSWVHAFSTSAKDTAAKSAAQPRPLGDLRAEDPQ